MAWRYYNKKTYFEKSYYIGSEGDKEKKKIRLEVCIVVRRIVMYWPALKKKRYSIVRNKENS